MVRGGKLCDPWQTKQFLQAVQVGVSSCILLGMRFVTTFQQMDDSRCDCKPDCNSTDYSVASHSAPFR